MAFKRPINTYRTIVYNEGAIWNLKKQQLYTSSPN